MLYMVALGYLKLYHHYHCVYLVVTKFEVTIQRATTVVNVTVTRNEFEPRFTQGEYRREAMNEKTAVGTKILTVSASDKDGVCRIQLYLHS